MHQQVRNFLLQLIFCQGVRSLLAAIAGWLLAGPAMVSAQPTVSPPAKTSPRPEAVVYEAGLKGFGDPAYQRAVEALFTTFEENTGRSLDPGEKGRVGLKVYTNSGAGIATPKSLVRAVVAALVRRGFDRADLFILDLDERTLRAAGYMPPISRGGARFEGVPVYALSTGDYYDPVWFYDSPLPPRNPSPDWQRYGLTSDLAADPDAASMTSDDRKSLLPVPLLLETDFWINLPMALDNRAFGISGALANPTLWAISNHERFFVNPATAQAAAVEIAAIPELQETWAFTLMTLERFQFIGGPVFRSLYTKSEPVLWLSPDPVLLDALMVRKINVARRLAGFREISETLPLFEFAETLNLGTSEPGEGIFVPVSTDP
ncbi:MAG: DUF362 domain-containing protein [Opitutales bacterium]